MPYFPATALTDAPDAPDAPEAPITRKTRKHGIHIEVNETGRQLLDDVKQLLFDEFGVRLGYNDAIGYLIRFYQREHSNAARHQHRNIQEAEDRCTCGNPVSPVLRGEESRDYRRVD